MSASNGYVVLVDDDRVGVRVLEELVALGVAVRGVCADADTPFARAARADGAPIAIGDLLQREEHPGRGGRGHARACGLLVTAYLVNLHAARGFAQA
jgi:hypothetical protein